MFVLAVALICGVAAGYALGGRLQNLNHLDLTMPWLILLALGIQLVIFSPTGPPFGEGLTVSLHLASYGLILLFAILNRQRAGIQVAGLGTLLNATVIAANGGYMPATESALRAAGRAVEAQPHNNSAVADETVRLLFLGDVMAVPDWVPFVANVFSVGDVLIAAGIAALLASAMRGPQRSVPRRRALAWYTVDGEPEAP